MMCPLCESSLLNEFFVKKKPSRNYFHCMNCDLIFMDSSQWLTPEEERTRYDYHQNEDSLGYRRFLEPLILDIKNYATSLAKAPAEMKILDFGSGPTAFLDKLLAEHSFKVTNYDLFYADDQKALNTAYDVITSTEVWEHFHYPKKEITRLVEILKGGGILAVMTSAHPGLELFPEWQYRRDLTHVIFFSEKTMEWIAKQFNLELINSKNPYWIFQKKA